MYVKKYPPMLKLMLKRKEARMTIRELAKKVGLNYNTISQYEMIVLFLWEKSDVEIFSGGRPSAR